MNMLEKQRVLITGGGGFLGSKLAERLSFSNIIVGLLDVSFNEFSKSLINENVNISEIEVDLFDFERLMSCCQSFKPDYVFHFAAKLNRDRDFSLYDDLYKVNVLGTLNLLESLKHVDYKGFYFASSSEVYGPNNKPPFSEEQIPLPASPYSLSKYMAEMLGRTFSILNNKPFVVLRFFNFYGFNMSNETFIGQMFEHYLLDKKFRMTGGIQKRDFIYIDELLDQVLFIVNNQEHLIDTFNICSGVAYKMIDVVSAFKTLTNNKFDYECSLNYRNNEIWDMYGSNKKLLANGYIMKNSTIEESLKIMLEKYIENA